MSLGCRPTVGSSSTKSAPVSEVPRPRVSETRCASPPEVRLPVERQVTEPHAPEVAEALRKSSFRTIACAVVVASACAEPRLGLAQLEPVPRREIEVAPAVHRGPAKEPLALRVSRSSYDQ
ncbi:MAG: hypothetical protein U0359_01870 [Byssovorax sp.]